MNFQTRKLQTKLQDTLNRNKSVILLGARQTGKTTLLKHAFNPDLYYNFAKPRLRREFELEPDRLADEIMAFKQAKQTIKLPLVIIDEVQKVPEIIDVAQYLIDDDEAKFVLTGSSARKLKKRKNGDINLLPGRVIKLQLDALTLDEIPSNSMDIKNLLLYGQLPEICLEPNNSHKESNLTSYVDIYLEEEIRQEALVRNLAAFSRFLELAAIEAGNIINFSKLSQEIGVNIHLIHEYFQILEDCLIIDKVSPITKTFGRRRLTKSPKYLFFDLGVKRICAKEGSRLSKKSMGKFFEQFVGMELKRNLRLHNHDHKLCYWRDHAGPEIDFVIDAHDNFIPIEVKWTDNPSKADSVHLLKFLNEYPCHDMAYVVCQISRRRMLTDRILALPWQELTSIID